ncbi:MAG: PD40 domain-containing protein [Pelolinea sp.]|nr:PD40 domain-containing protein [Pelolinea sp.]
MKSITLMKRHLNGLQYMVIFCFLAALILSACTTKAAPTAAPTPSQPSPTAEPSQMATMPNAASPSPSETIEPSPQIGTPVAETQEASPQPTPVGSMHWVEPEADHALVFVFQALGGAQEIYFLDPRGNPPKLLTTINNEDFLQIIPSPDGKVLAIHGRPQEGVGNDWLSLLSLEDNSLEPVLQDTWFTSFAWSSDSKQLAFSEIPVDGTLEINVFDTETKSIDTVFDRNLNLRVAGWVMNWAMSEQKLLVTHAVGGGYLNDEALLIDTTSGEAESVYTDPRKMTGWVAPVPIGDLALIYQLDNFNDRRGKLVLYDLDTRQSMTVLNREDKYSSLLNGPVWSPDGHYAAFTSEIKDQTDEEATVSLLVFDRATGEISVVLENQPAYLSGLLGWASDNVLVITQDTWGVKRASSIHVDGSGWQEILAVPSLGGMLTTIKMQP